MKPTLSIIIPTYNSFHLMKRGIDSIEAIESLQVEVVIVDDFSTDGTYEKLIEYQSSSKHTVKVIRNEINVGPGVSRNVGIQNADGKYITFMDSDDFFSSSMYSAIIDYVEMNVDCIIFDATIYRSDAEQQVLPMFVKHQANGPVNVENAIVYLRGSTWGKVYKKELIASHKIRFLPQNRSEDVPFTKHAISCCESLVYIKKPLYMYVQQDMSLMHNKQLTNYENAERAFLYMAQMISNRYSSEVEALFIKEYLIPVACQRQQLNGTRDMKTFVDRAVKMYPNCLSNGYFRRETLLRKILALIVFHKLGLLLEITNKLKIVRNSIKFRTQTKR